MGKICTFLGYDSFYFDMESLIEQNVRPLIEKENVDTFLVGKQGNFSICVSQTLEKLHREYPHINIVLVETFLHHLKREGYRACGKTRTVEENINKNMENKIVSVSDFCLVKLSNYIIVYAAHKNENTHKAFLMAKRCGKKIITLDFVNL